MGDPGQLMTLAKRRGFFWPSFDIYGGVAGFFDWGPMGVKLKLNFLDLWRSYYALEEGFIELDAPSITPYEIFEASGHVEKFTDLMTQCDQCNQSFRADHLVEEFHPNADALEAEEIQELIVKHDVKCPTCGGGLGEITTFNLMFPTTIGPGGQRKAFLRPETAQNIFINFSTLYRQARERLPFGVIQIGKGFRNEISPRQGIVRVREFQMAEAEFFCHPTERTYPKFGQVKDTPARLVANTAPEDTVETTFGKAVEEGLICNETLAYFMCLTQRMFVEAGMDPERLRFRQHLQTEMAHYAADCWDMEGLTSLGWIELVGHADRSCFDLEQHMEHSCADLRVFRKYDEPVRMVKRVAKPNNGVIGPMFKAQAKAVLQAAEGFTDEQLETLANGPLTLDIGGESVTIPPECFEVVEEEVVEHGEKFVPSVIEPSYGVGRTLFTLLEHALEVTEKVDEETGKKEPYTILHLKPIVAPIKVGVFPLMAKDGLDTMAEKLDQQLRDEGLTTFFDGSGSIGRRYARADEVGIPLAITVDYDSLDDATVTLRDRDTTHQVRVPADKVVGEVQKVLAGKLAFDDVEGKRQHIID